jgi:hypothetical protein
MLHIVSKKQLLTLKKLIVAGATPPHKHATALSQNHSLFNPAIRDQAMPYTIR